MGYFFKAILEALVIAIVLFFGSKYLWKEYKEYLPKPVEDFLEEVKAFFKKVNKETFTIKASASEGGKISHDGVFTVDRGSDFTLIITPDTDHMVLFVWVDGVAVVYKNNGDSVSIIDIDDDHEIRVEFN